MLIQTIGGLRLSGLLKVRIQLKRTYELCSHLLLVIGLVRLLTQNELIFMNIHPLKEIMTNIVLIIHETRLIRCQKTRFVDRDGTVGFLRFVVSEWLSRLITLYCNFNDVFKCKLLIKIYIFIILSNLFLTLELNIILVVLLPITYYSSLFSILSGSRPFFSNCNGL